MIHRIRGEIEEFFIAAEDLSDDLRRLEARIAQAVSYESIPLFRTFAELKLALGKRASRGALVALNGDSKYTKDAISYAMRETEGNCIFSAAWCTKEALYHKTLFENKILVLRNPDDAHAPIDWQAVHAKFSAYRGHIYRPVRQLDEFSARLSAGIAVSSKRIHLP